MKTKKSLPGNLGLYLTGICWIYSCWLAFDRFIFQRSNLDGGTLNLNGGMLTLDGGMRPPRSPYNLSTDHQGIVWNEMKDDFFVLYTGNFLPFHTKNLPFHIPFHTKIFFHIPFHTKIFFLIPSHASIPKKF